MSLSRTQSLWARPLTVQRQVGVQQQQAEGDGGAGGGNQPALTQAMRDEILSLLGTTVNNTITARLTKFGGELQTKMADGFGKLLDDKLRDFRPAAEPDDKDGKGGGKNSTELATLRKQVSDQAKAQNDLLERLNRERATNRNIALRTAVQEQLAGMGITDPVRFKAAYAMLQAEGRLRFEDDNSDNIVFVDDAGNALEHSVGLQAWAKTPEAALFIPPKGTQGAGSRPGAGNGAPPPGPKNKQEAQALAFAEVAKEIGGVFGGINGRF
jgi:hypothetical protein